MPTFSIERGDPDHRAVTWSDIGPAGHIEPVHIAAKRTRGPRTEWRAVTLAGLESPNFTRQSDAAWWLYAQVVPYAPPPAPPDPMLELIRRHIRQGHADRADSAVLACILEDIRNMKRKRAHHSPPAVWHHLDQYETWIKALNAEDVTPDERHAGVIDEPRVVDLLAAIKRHRNAG